MEDLSNHQALVPTDLQWASFSTSELEAIKRHVTRNRPYANRVSIALAIRLLKIEYPFSVLLETDYLEGLHQTSRTKDEQQFKHIPLHPFWHKHFFTSRDVLRNIGIHWGLDKHGNHRLEALTNDIAEIYGNDVDQWQAMLPYKVVLGGFEERVERGLTGNWIIFAKHDGQNYYLDLAKHEEGDNPQDLLAKLRNGSFVEFPFLFERSG